MAELRRKPVTEHSDSSLYALTNAIPPTRRAWVKASGRAIAETGLSMPLAFAVLNVSRLGPTLLQKTLSAALGVNPAALVRVLDQGEEAGLLVRREVQGDRRAKAVDLLPKGQRLAEQMEQTLAALRDELLGDLPAEDADAAVRVLRRLEERAIAWLRRDQTD